MRCMLGYINIISYKVHENNGNIYTTRIIRVFTDFHDHIALTYIIHIFTA